MLKSAFVSVCSLLSSGLVAVSPLFPQVSLAQSPLNSQLELFQLSSDWTQHFLEHHEQNTKDSQTDASRGDSRRTSP